MKSQIVLLVSLCLCGVTAQEMNTKKHTIPLKTIKKIRIDLEGAIILNSWSIPKGEIDVEITVSGFHWAIGGGKKSKKNYDVDIQELEDMIHIKKKKVRSYPSVGISHLRTIYRHIIHLPENMDIVIRSKDANVLVNGNFRSLDIENEEGTSRLEIHREKIKFLECLNLNGLVAVNDSLFDMKYRLLGEGDQVYSVTTTEGEIALVLAK